MTNKINGITTAEPVARPSGSSSNGVVTDKSLGEGSSSSVASQTGDHVTLTDSARTLQRIEETVAKTPVVNSEKVAAVKQAIGAGTYKIDPARVADKLMKYERGLK